MKIIPVIDILRGVVVHAVAGERSLYKPVKSVLVDTPDPIKVAAAFKEALRRDTLYVADLDAIAGLGENTDVVKRLKQSLSLTIMVDAGACSLAEVKKAIREGFDYVVVGTETLRRLGELKEILESPFKNKVVASLDIKAQSTLSRCGELKGLEPIEAAKTLRRAGVGRLIVLELDRVGTLQGPNIKLLEAVCKTPFEEVLAGGGVRSRGDLLALKALNISGVLVASALHSGGLTLDDLLALEALRAP